MAYVIWPPHQEASELEPRNELAVPLAADVARVDEAKPAAQLARRVSGGRFGRIAAGRLQIKSVEDVEDLRPDIELHFFLYGEAAAQAHVLRDLAPPAIVVIETGGLPELARRRVRPGGRIQHEVLPRINAPTIGILQEQRLPRYPVHARPLKDQRTEIVVRSGRADELAAGVAQS